MNTLCTLSGCTTTTITTTTTTSTMGYLACALLVSLVLYGIIVFAPKVASRIMWFLLAMYYYYMPFTWKKIQGKHVEAPQQLQTKYDDL